MLAYDILQLAGLLYLTGGVANPFSILFLAPVTIAATSLELKRALALLGLAILCATVLARWSLPAPWKTAEGLDLPAAYLVGVWAALAVSAAFVTLYAYRVAAEARQLGGALATTELALQRAQHLSQLDGLAAAAAHELGTPLATMALVVREMSAEPAQSDCQAEDLKLLEQSVERCRDILGKLAAPGGLADGQMEISSPVELVELAAAPHRLLGVAVTVEGDGPEPAPRCARNAGVLFGLGNLIENAVSFADSRVDVRASWTKSSVEIRIADDGQGFPPAILARVGEPYISQRDRARRNEEAGGGLGLGLFIASSLIQRSRATLRLDNAAPPGKGAIVTIHWPRSAYEDGRRNEP